MKIMRLNSIKSRTWVKNSQKWLSILCHQKKFFCVCMYKMLYISTETWNKTEISVIKIHENYDVNKTVLLLFCISDVKKIWGGKNLYDLIEIEIKGKYEV